MINKDLRKKICSIKLLISDVDGVLTNGSIYKGSGGIEFKQFNVLDGAGAAIAKAGGLKIALISGRYSEATEIRANEMKFDDVYNGTINKVPSYEELKEKYQLSDCETAFIGDDIIDIPVMEKVGLAVAVNNANNLVKDVAHHITTRNGGEGAFREVVDFILHTQGIYEATLEKLRGRISNDPDSAN